MGRQQFLLPGVVDEGVERRRPPVDGALVVGLDGEHARPLLREVDAAVVRVPDVLDADGGPSLRRQVPLLPVEELRFRDAVPARGDERSDRERGRDEDLRCTPARGRPEARDECERRQEQQHAPPEVVVPGEDRRRPARSGHEHEACEERTARGDRERRQRCEREDREQDDAVHQMVLRGGERHEHVVEVEEPASRAFQDRPEGVRPDVERDRPRGDQRHACSGEPEAQRGQERRSDPEQDHQRDFTRGATSLQPPPVPREQEPEQERERRSLSHWPRAPPRARSASRRGRRPAAPRRPGRRPPGAAAAQAHAAERARRR